VISRFVSQIAPYAIDEAIGQPFFYYVQFSRADSGWFDDALLSLEISPCYCGVKEISHPHRKPSEVFFKTAEM
jgi:hypothetical protein